MASLEIAGSLGHNDDGLVRFSVRLTNGDFVATSSTWGNVRDHLQLADALQGFPASPDASISFAFGVRRSGYCRLDFFCTDRVGHVGLWADFESAYPVNNTKKYETASIFMSCEPAAIDIFVADLRAFKPFAENMARLVGVGPNEAFKPTPQSGAA